MTTLAQRGSLWAQCPQETQYIRIYRCGYTSSFDIDGGPGPLPSRISSLLDAQMDSKDVDMVSKIWSPNTVKLDQITVAECVIQETLKLSASRICAQYVFCCMQAVNSNDEIAAYYKTTHQRWEILARCVVERNPWTKGSDEDEILGWSGLIDRRRRKCVYE